MCDQRERLIGYVYDECEADERREVDAHLAGCQTCRDEIGGLRATRVDLLAWEVPPHASVWRPFAAPRVVAPWRQIPAWAMAAAASLIFMTGAAGGAAVRVLWPAVPTSAAVTPAAATAADIAALRTNLLTEVQTAVAQRVAMVTHDTSTSAPASTPVVSQTAVDALLARTAALEKWKRDQIALNVVFDSKMARIGRQNVSSQSELNPQALQRRVSMEFGR